MPELTRRVFLWRGAGAAILVAGCASRVSALAQLQDDTALLIAGLRGVLPALQALPPSALPQDVLAALRMDIQEAALFANDIASSQSEAQAAAPAQSMAAAVDSAVSATSKLTLPPHVRSVFAAADALLPAIEAPLGQAAAVAFYSPDQARVILRQSAGRTV